MFIMSWRFVPRLHFSEDYLGFKTASPEDLIYFNDSTSNDSTSFQKRGRPPSSEGLVWSSVDWAWLARDWPVFPSRCGVCRARGSITLFSLLPHSRALSSPAWSWVPACFSSCRFSSAPAGIVKLVSEPDGQRLPETLQQPEQLHVLIAVILWQERPRLE